MKKLLFFLLIPLLFSCEEETKPPTIIGEWEVVKMCYEDGSCQYYDYVWEFRDDYVFLWDGAEFGTWSKNQDEIKVYVNSIYQPAYGNLCEWEIEHLTKEELTLRWVNRLYYLTRLFES